VNSVLLIKVGCYRTSRYKYIIIRLLIVWSEFSNPCLDCISKTYTYNQYNVLALECDISLWVSLYTGPITRTMASNNPLHLIRKYLGDPTFYSIASRNYEAPAKKPAATHWCQWLWQVLLLCCGAVTGFGRGLNCDRQGGAGPLESGWQTVAKSAHLTLSEQVLL